ncbi:hypothetical protein VKT23_006650 [Stygiomarasmius scandens]|uniref:ubiquitinyl hydrolase 1 n=1 Tax=Marasmiellus scandens TaxID=2682957 RepID=A0ABR1JR91_9AGAR
MHQDAHEFFNYLLNKIVEEIEEERKHQQNNTASAEDLSKSVATIESAAASTSTNSNGGFIRSATLVQKLFEGTLTSETRCLTCETVSSRDESFIDLSIDIEQNSSVTACLRQFSASEMLCHKNKFFCDSCCDLQEAEKRMKIKKLPNILALHLKRFKFQEDLQKYIKLAYRVAFPFQLRLFNTVDDAEDADRLYSLYAIVVHIGNGPHHGHYISIIKTAGTWLVFDDDNVYTIQESDIPKYYGDSNSGAAYVLYYEAVDINLSALGVRTPSLPTTSAASVAPAEPVLVPSSPQTNPAVPPGLTEEPDSSDLSDPSYPLTPPPQSSPLLSPDKNKSIPLEIQVPASAPNDAAANSASPAVPSPSPATNGRGATKGLLGTLGRKPPAKPELSASSPSTARERTVSGAEEDSGTRQTPSPSQPIPPETKEKEKEKEKKDSDRKSGGWFGVGKRKSLKATTDKFREALSDMPGSPVSSPKTENHTASSSSNGSSHRFRSATGPAPKKPRKPSSDVSMFDAATFAPMAAGRHSAIYDSPPGSATSSTGSTHLNMPTLPSSAPSPTVLNSPPPRKSSLNNPAPSPFPTSPDPPPRSPDHKKSLTSLPRKNSHKRAATDGPRPATATGTPADTMSTPRPLPPVPPLPSLVANGHVHAATVDSGKPTTTTDSFATNSNGNGAFMNGRPMSSGGAPPGLSSLVGANTSASSGSSGPIKRATRKLSISSPMLGLGFGKKKDKDDKAPPSSYQSQAYHSTPIS